MAKIINLHRISYGTCALGPGRRYVVWTQGCPFRCDGCLTPEGRSTEPYELVDVASLAEDIVSRKQIDGITISGGEPFLQAEVLAELLQKVKEVRPELTVICFTGYLLEKLVTPEQQALLKQLDLLIDGPFIKDKNDGRGLRGSTNQRLHFLTDRLAEYKEELETGKRKLEVIVSNKTIVQIGIPGTSPNLSQGEEKEYLRTL